MNTVPTAIATAAAALARSDIRARKAGFVADLVSVAGRALRSIPREPEMLGPALFIPLFFYVVNVGALQDFSQAGIAGLRLQGVPAAGVPSSSRSPASPGPPSWSPTSRTATSTGCC